jgi:hypothetical protein
MSTKNHRRSFGSIRKLQSGNYKARFKKDGTWFNAPATSLTKTAANAWLAHQQVALSKGTFKHPKQQLKELLYGQTDGIR